MPSDTIYSYLTLYQTIFWKYHTKGSEYKCKQTEHKQIQKASLLILQHVCSNTTKLWGHKKAMNLAGRHLHTCYSLLVLQCFYYYKSHSNLEKCVPARFITLLLSPWNTLLCFEHWRTCVANVFTLFACVFLGFELSVKYKFFISQISLINFKTSF